MCVRVCVCGERGREKILYVPPSVISTLTSWARVCSFFVFYFNFNRELLQLKSNFAIHCKTDKHISRQQLAVHIREGGVTNEWRLRYVPKKKNERFILIK